MRVFICVCSFVCLSSCIYVCVCVGGGGGGEVRACATERVYYVTKKIRFLLRDTNIPRNTNLRHNEIKAKGTERTRKQVRLKRCPTKEMGNEKQEDSRSDKRLVGVFGVDFPCNHRLTKHLSGSMQTPCHTSRLYPHHSFPEMAVR